jgi:hypothetical protein
MAEYVVACLPHSPMLAFDILHMVALESFHGCLLASCAAPPSSRATEDDLSYTISFLIFFYFVGTRNPSYNQFCLQMISASRLEEEY